MASWGFEIEVHNVVLIVTVKSISIELPDLKIFCSPQNPENSSERFFQPVQIGPTAEQEVAGINQLAEYIWNILRGQDRFASMPKPNFKAQLYGSKLAIHVPRFLTPEQQRSVPPNYVPPATFYLSADRYGIMGFGRIFSFVGPEFISAPWPERDPRFTSLRIPAEIFTAPILDLWEKLNDTIYPKSLLELYLYPIAFEIYRLNEFFLNYFEKNLELNDFQIYFRADITLDVATKYLPPLPPEIAQELKPRFDMQMTGAIDLTHFCPLFVNGRAQCSPFLREIVNFFGINERAERANQILDEFNRLPIEFCNRLMDPVTGIYPGFYPGMRSIRVQFDPLSGPYRVGIFCLVRYIAFVFVNATQKQFSSVKNFWVLYLKTSIIQIIRAYLLNEYSDDFNLKKTSRERYIAFITNSQNLVDITANSYDLQGHDANKVLHESLNTKLRIYATETLDRKMPAFDFLEGLINVKELILGILIAPLFPLSVGSTVLLRQFAKAFAPYMYKISRPVEGRLLTIIDLVTDCLQGNPLPLESKPGHGRIKMELRNHQHSKTVPLDPRLFERARRIWFELGDNIWNVGHLPMVNDPDNVEDPASAHFKGGFPNMEPIS